MNNNCICDEECFVFINISTGEQISRCSRFDDKKCDYRLVRQIMKPGFKKKAKETMKSISKKETIKEKLNNLGNAFISNQRLATFHEIETLSGIKYDSNKEHILEWINRICKIK